MTKKTKTVTGDTERKPPETPAPEKERQHGPLKEKTQITIRIDKELMDRAYAQIKGTNSRITDVLERGLWLAMKEQDQDLPALTNRVRFVVANTTKQQQQQIDRFLICLVLDEFEKLTPSEALLRKSVFEYLELMEKVPDRRARALELYSRYGRTPEEIEQTGS
jgi:uncharacterized protein (DUF4415 family)